MTEFRISTFNLENFDETGPGIRPLLDERIALMRPQVLRLRADVALFHQGRGQMLDHLLITRNLLPDHRGSEIRNEVLHDESAAFATDLKYRESDHAPVVAGFAFG